MEKANEKELLVSEVIEGIANKEYTISQIAELLGVTAKTVKNHIKRLGFKWTGKRHEYIGESELESVYAISFTSIVKEGNIIGNQREVNKEVATTAEENLNKNVKTKSITRVKRQATTSNNASKGNKKNSKIDLLLSGKSVEYGRTYRGFYIDNDLLEVIDSRVNSGSKSELINEIIREALEERGLI